MKTGCLYWITGLAGAGKTTLARRLFLDLKSHKENTVLLDGDVLRDIYRLPSGHYTEEQRYDVAMRHAKMCKLLTSQGIDVICATISLFKDVRAWNRQQNKKYIEIFMDVSDQTLLRRNKNNLYIDEMTDNPLNQVVGKGVKAEYPKKPDIILRNEGTTGIEPVFLKLKRFLDDGVNEK